MSAWNLQRGQSGLTYVEVIITAAIMAIALVPAIDALYTGMLGTRIYQSSSSEHYSALAMIEEVLAEPHSVLVAGAAVAGNATTPSSYSDPPGSPNRRLVYLALYDADNEDADNDPFTVPDPNLDGDSDPYTGYTGLLWVRVEMVGSTTFFESLSAP